MAATTTSDLINLKQLLAPEIYDELHEAAKHQQITVRDLVREAIEAYVAALDEEDEEEIEETPDEEILASFKQAWHEAMTGQTRPVEEFLAELDAETDDDAN